MSAGPAVLLSFPHVLGRAGIGSIAAAQVRELDLAGASVTVVTAGLEPGLVLPPTVRVHTSLSVGSRRIPHRALGSVDRALAWHDLFGSRIVARLARRNHPAIDIVHGWPGAGRRTFQAARAHHIASVREVPNTHTAHAYSVMQTEMAKLGLPVTAGHSHATNPGRLAAEEREYDLATALLCPAESVARTFRARGFPDERLLLHQYGYEAGAGFGAGGPRPADGPFRLLFVGRCEPRKGLHFALDAWIASGIAAQGATFDIFGSFYPGYAELLGARLQAPGVRVRGFTTDVPAEMAAADALTLPSLEEGSALVTYEAQAAGCALLVSDEAGALCEQGVQGRVHPSGDIAALAADLRLLATDRPLLRSMQAAARAQAEHLTWADAATVLLGRYQDARELAAGAA